MALTNLSVPSISISFAIADEPRPEPFSPFDVQTTPAGHHDGYLLSPTPLVSPRFHRQSSPLRPSHAVPTANGLDHSRFEALLASTRERNANPKKELDLRKELALKAHKCKQRTHP